MRRHSFTETGLRNTPPRDGICVAGVLHLVGRHSSKESSSIACNVDLVENRIREQENKGEQGRQL
jgi:hypothetical protein